MCTCISENTGDSCDIPYQYIPLESVTADMNTQVNKGTVETLNLQLLSQNGTPAS